MTKVNQLDFNSIILEATPTIETSAYASGDLIGEKIRYLDCNSQ